jgi:opacity protein-like surface antigen
MKTKLLAGAALFAIFAASGASAQVVNGFYGAIDLGYHMPEGVEAESSNNMPNGSRYDWTFDSEDDYAGFARIGYRISPQFRLELEGGYRGGDIESVRGSTAPGAIQGLCSQAVLRTAANPTCQSPAGSIQSYTVMANAIYDFDFNLFQRFVPFVGVGAGINRLNFDVIGQFSNVGTVTAANPAFQNLVIDDEDVVFAYQGLAGLTFNATERLALDLTYRYLSGAEADFQSTGSARTGTPAVASGLQPGMFSGRYEDQSITLGLRFAFAPPPPPPEPLPCRSRLRPRRRRRSSSRPLRPRRLPRLRSWNPASSSSTSRSISPR